MAGVFCDSFAHYNSAGIPLKYSTAGGSIQTNMAHVRTGIQSLQIQAGDAPSIINFALPADTSQTYIRAPKYYTFAVGLAYQAGALNGRIFSLLRNLTAPSGTETLLYLVLNADGSLSLFTDGGTLLGQSAAGVITAGVFYYITLTADIGGFSEATFATVNVTTAALVSTDVISVSGFVLADTFVDEFDFGGPAASAHAWVNDFYFQDLRDGSAVPFAPSVYAVIPNEDGTPVPNPGDGAGWQPVSSTHIPLIDSVPQSEAQGIQWNVGYTSGGNLVTGCFETYFYDVSGLPDGRTVGFIQGVFLWEYGIGELPVNVLSSDVMQDDSGNVAGQVFGPFTLPNQPFMFVVLPEPLDPFTGNPWLISDWKAGIRQYGPSTISAGP
jgi:hypothetical protein